MMYSQIGIPQTSAPRINLICQTGLAVPTYPILVHLEIPIFLEISILRFLKVISRFQAIISTAFLVI